VSALAIFAGLAFTVATTTLADQFLSAPQSDIEWAVHLLYRLLFDVGGCAIAAGLAPARPLRHALILGALLVGFAAAWLLQSWKDPSVPRWHPLALTLLALPTAWVGERGARLARGTR
jgi:hypothetical protein